MLKAVSKFSKKKAVDPIYEASAHGAGVGNLLVTPETLAKKRKNFAKEEMMNKVNGEAERQAKKQKEKQQLNRANQLKERAQKREDDDFRKKCAQENKILKGFGNVPLPKDWRCHADSLLVRILGGSQGPAQVPAAEG